MTSVSFFFMRVRLPRCFSSQRTAVSFEALAQDPPTEGFSRRNNPSKNNLVIGDKIDMARLLVIALFSIFWHCPAITTYCIF
jgi:hypothetical protein